MKYPIDKQELLEEFRKSKKAGFRWTERFGELLIELHKLVLRKPNFHNYKQDFKRDMTQYSLLRMMIGLRNFDDSKPIFPYLYRAVHMNFWQFCIQHYRRQNRYNQYVYDQLVQMQADRDISDEQKKILLGLSQDPWVRK